MVALVNSCNRCCYLAKIRIDVLNALDEKYPGNTANDTSGIDIYGEKTEGLSKKNSIEGTYIGTISSENENKNAFITGSSFEATAIVSDIGDGQIEVHCFGDEIDTTFMLNYYEHNNSVMVCFNGDAFEETYGHMLGQGGMMGNGNSSGGMMNGLNNDNTDWMNHMYEEHTEDDNHFGGFDMTNHTFDYTIKREGSDYHFQGTKR